MRTITRWTLASAISFGVTGALFHNFPVLYRTPPMFGGLGRFDLNAAAFGGLAFGALPALLIGTVQRAVLRRHLKLPRRWILTFALGVGALHFISDGFPDAHDMTLAVVASGMALAVYQWRLLKRGLGASPLWVPATVVAWYGGWAIGLDLLDSLGMLNVPWTPSLGFWQHGILGASIGIAYGALTGVLVARLARPPTLDAMQSAMVDHMYRW